MSIKINVFQDLLFDLSSPYTWVIVFCPQSLPVPALIFPFLLLHCFHLLGWLTQNSPTSGKKNYQLCPIHIPPLPHSFLTIKYRSTLLCAKAGPLEAKFKLNLYKSSHEI